MEILVAIIPKLILLLRIICVNKDNSQKRMKISKVVMISRNKK